MNTASVFEKWLHSHAAILHKVSRAFAYPEPGDLYQEMLLQLWLSIPYFRGQCKDSTWIYRVALNTAVTWRRKERKHTGVPLETEPPARCADERLEELYAAIRQLKPIDRTLMLLHLDGYSYQEIAEITGLSTSNVGVRLLRCKDRLLETIKSEAR